MCVKDRMISVVCVWVMVDRWVYGGGGGIRSLPLPVVVTSWGGGCYNHMTIVLPPPQSP